MNAAKAVRTLRDFVSFGEEQVDNILDDEVMQERFKYLWWNITHLYGLLGEYKDLDTIGASNSYTTCLSLLIFLFEMYRFESTRRGRRWRWTARREARKEVGRRN